MDMMQPGHGPEEEEDDAAQAFEALRGEVAALRRGIELVYRQAQQAPAAALDAPDYSPTLGAIAQELRAFGKRLDGMEAHPALKLTPAAYATQVTEGVRRVEGEAARSLTHAQGRFSDGLHELRSLIGSAHSQFVQQRREWIAAAIGAALGFVVWWPLAFLTPWGGGHWLASTLIGGGRWGAGADVDRGGEPGRMGADGAALPGVPAGHDHGAVRGGAGRADHPAVIGRAGGAVRRHAVPVGAAWPGWSVRAGKEMRAGVAEDRSRTPRPPSVTEWVWPWPHRPRPPTDILGKALRGFDRVPRNKARDCYPQRRRMRPDKPAIELIRTANDEGSDTELILRT
jgi:hypothetical protein